MLTVGDECVGARKDKARNHQQELSHIGGPRGCLTVAVSGGLVISSHMQQFELSEKEQASWLLTWNVWCLVSFVIFIIKEYIN